MSISHFFDGNEEVIPGAYSTIKSGIKNTAVILNAGNALIIDTGSGKFFGGGSGVNGELKSGKDALYAFGKVGDFRTYQRGGLLWLLGGALFNPGGGAQAGVDTLSIIRACTTVAATINMTFGSSTSDGDANDAYVNFQPNSEGYVANGVLGDETRAKATITITNAGTAGATISVRIAGELAGTYVVKNGDTIANVVAGLVADINLNGLCEVFSSNATQLVIYAPHGAADSLNSLPATILVTGSVAGNSGNFSGGAEGTLLTRGYAVKMSSGIANTSKFIVKFYRGTFKGLNGDICADNSPYDAIPELSTKPELLCQTPEISTVTELVNYMQSNYKFKTFFTLLNSSIASVDQITTDDLNAYSVYEKAVGGSTSYSIDDLSRALEVISDLTYDFVLADQWGQNARSASNLAIQEWILNEASIKPDLYIAAGSDVSEWDFTNDVAVAYDSQYVTVVHGGAKKIKPGGGFYEYDSIFKAAALMGREAGLAPQIPLTFKNVGIEGEVHQLEKKDVKRGLASGVLMTKAEGNSFEVVEGINTLQNSSLTVNPDGSSYDKQFNRIERQLNKELKFNLKNGLLKKPTGANRNTVKAEDVKTFVENYLQTRTVTDQVDNLLISFNGVDVVRDQDAYNVTYVFEGNTAINFIFATGFVIDSQS